MKIDNNSGSVGGVTGSESRKPAAGGAAKQGASAPTSGASGEGVKVQLSAMSGHLQEVEAALANSPVVDAGRVSEIKLAITEGRFRVDAGKVADGLIQSVREMLASQARAN